MGLNYLASFLQTLKKSLIYWLLKINNSLWLQVQVLKHSAFSPTLIVYGVNAWIVILRISFKWYFLLNTLHATKRENESYQNNSVPNSYFFILQSALCVYLRNHIALPVGPRTWFKCFTGFSYDFIYLLGFSILALLRSFAGQWQHFWAPDQYLLDG